MLLMSGLGSDRTVEQFTCTKHGVHDHGELARDRDGRALEADLLLEFQAPDTQRAVCRGARQAELLGGKYGTIRNFVCGRA